jgi:hypothetical protein
VKGGGMGGDVVDTVAVAVVVTAMKVLVRLV